MNSKHLSIFLLLLVVFVGLFFYLVDRYSALEKRINEIDTKTEKVKEKTNPVANDVPTDNLTKNWKIYIYDGPRILGFKNFEIKYPENWMTKIDHDTSDEVNMRLSVLFTNKENGDSFEIMQGVGGGGRCLFTVEADYDTFDGMGTKYDNHIDINNLSMMMRLAKDVNGLPSWTHVLCQKSGKEYYDSTSFGFTNINIKNADSERELIKMLESVVIK